MIGKKVYINAKDNFYDDMAGTIIEEFPLSVLVEIPIITGSHKVVFYKNQIKHYV